MVQDADRIIKRLWAEARARFGGGGPFLFGTFGAVDIMYAPIISRFSNLWIPSAWVSRKAYMQTMIEQAWMVEWMESAEEEPWVIEKFDSLESSKT